MVTRHFSESLHPVSTPKSGNDGDFIFAQTAYTFDVGFGRCTDFQESIASFNGPVKHYDYLVKSGTIFDDEYQVFVSPPLSSSVKS